MRIQGDRIGNPGGKPKKYDAVLANFNASRILIIREEFEVFRIKNTAHHSVSLTGTSPKTPAPVRVAHPFVLANLRFSGMR